MNEYLKTVFKDEEIYHCSFKDFKKGSVWEHVGDWNTSNARNFKLPVCPYPLTNRFKDLCKFYRWFKINYISIYLNVSSYTYNCGVDAPFRAQMKTDKSWEGKIVRE